MTPNKELKLAYYLAVTLLLVGVISYAAFPKKIPEQPFRIMFSAVSGKVLFDHKTHTSESGYGIVCYECHHNLEENETDPELCGDCHEPVSEEEGVPNRADAFHLQCAGCHDDFGAGPMTEECNSCHVL